jgi:hypothetical protein
MYAQFYLQVIDNLSRLGSPSPARSGTPNSRSPVPSQTGSSRSQSIRTVRTITQASQRHETIRSGSETERESTHQSNSTHSNSSHSASSHPHSISSTHRSASQYSHRSTTPPPSSELNPNTSPYSRMRHISAPESPHKARVIAASTSSDSNSSKSPSHRKRNRVSMASVHLADFDEEGAADASGTKLATGTARDRKDRILSEADIITQSALAAVASSRHSPVGNRRRSALPREFRSDLADDTGAKKGAGRYDVGRGSPEEERRDKTKVSSSLSFKPRQQSSTRSFQMGLEPLQPFTPFRPAPNGVGRSSTVRERRIPISPRWSSDDYRTPATLRTRPFNTSYSNEDGNPRRERQQSLRGVSVESAMWSPTGRSLISEGLRAAGLTRRKEEEAKGKRAARESGTNGDVFTERVRKVDWSPQDVIDDGTRRALVDRERERTMPQRASTSMAQYQYLDRDSPDAPRGHRSAYSLVLHERDSSTGERTTSALSRHTPGNTPRLAPTHLQERMNSASPFGTRRHGATLTPQTEHARLMLDSLTLFETSLAKIPRSAASSINVGSLSSHADVLQNAQGMVFAADRLYNLLKQGSSRAIEAQVEAEVESADDDPQIKEIVDLWGKVAADYREGSRMADDLIRGITGVLLGIGRVMREIMVERDVTEFGSPSVHGRHASLGDDNLRRTSPDVSHLHNSGGRSDNSSERQSVSSKGSRGPPREGEREREETLRKLAGVRPESVLARASPATFQRLNNREHLDLDTLPITNGRSGVRRSSTLREQRVSTQDTGTLRGPSLVPADSQETIHPSPTPASRPKSSPAVGRARALPPISIPRPLPILPSETLLRRTTGESSGNEPSTTVHDHERRRAALRGSERPVFPSLTSPANPTIALTRHTVSNAERSSNPLQRADSAKSGRSQVTFSRPTAVSVEKSLSELQQADGFRKRTMSTSSAQDHDGFIAPPRQNMGVSGSETERDVTRQTLGVTRARMSLDIQREDDRTPSGVVADARHSTSHAADRSAAATVLNSAVKRDRRRTVTDIWQR